MQTDRGMSAIKPLILAAKGGDARKTGRNRSWEDIAEAMSQRPGGPDVCGDRVRDLVLRTAAMPPDGTLLRHLLAVLNVPLLDALAAAGYFPDMRWDGLSAFSRLVEAGRAVGAPFHACGQSGRRVAIEFDGVRS